MTYYYLKIGEEKYGFTNQIFALITGIICAYKSRKQIVIVDNFLNDINNNTYSPISNILNITKLNTFLAENYNMIIQDRNNINFKLVSVIYGNNEINTVDLTDVYKEQWDLTNKLFIDKNCNFNSIKGDPCPKMAKKITIIYKLNDYTIKEICDEKLKSDININFDGPYEFTLGWLDSFNNNMFDNILTNITYHDDFINKSESIINKINKKKKVNIIHLRLENDGITHWSKKNKMTHAVYLEHLENKYINLIKKYISKKDKTIILSSSASNRVIDFLNNDKYDYKFIDKLFEDREKNAIIDLLIAKSCNNVFIGNFNVQQHTGSSFSYYIWKMTNDTINKIYIDLDRIYDKAVLVSSIDV
jgi:hypothetical protein